MTAHIVSGMIASRPCRTAPPNNRLQPSALDEIVKRRG
jgi:hypothetical protein